MDQRIDWPSRTATWLSQNAGSLVIGLAAAAAMVAVMLVLRSIGQRIKTADPDCQSWRSVIGHVLAKTSLWFMVVLALDIVASYVDAPHVIRRTLEIAFTIVFAIQGAIWARELILGTVGHRVTDGKHSEALGNAMSLIRVLVNVALFAIAGILILSNLGVNVTALVAGLGIGGIAIGLAAQGIFSDLFAALAIIFDKPFRRGDTIRYDNTTGTVERIGLKTTRLRSLTGEQRVMANTKLLEREIQNLAVAKARRMTLFTAVSLDTPGEKLMLLPGIAVSAVSAQNGCKLVRCAALGVGSHSIAFELVYDDKSLDNNRNAENRSAVIIALLEGARSEQIELVRVSDVPPPLAPF